MNNTYPRRLVKAAAALETSGLDALLLGPGADMFYLTGFEHSHAGERLLALVLRRDGSALWICPALNAAQVQEFALHGHQVRAWSDSETYMPALHDALSGVRSLAFDDEARSRFLLDLLSVSPGMVVKPASEVMRGLRIRKDAVELEAMFAAAATVDDLIPNAVSLCQPGVKECEVEEQLRALLLRREPGCSVAFCIIASGPNSALPHHDTGSREILPGDVVVLDYGTRLHGYHSDITVVCAAGSPYDAEVERVYRTVWEAQQRALEVIRPGTLTGVVDAAARDHIAGAGYGNYFLHRTGHGLGLQVHEPPYLVGGSETRLEEGMVFSIEPGIYLPNRFGVRLEVIAAVTADGVQLLNAPSSPKILRSTDN